MSAAFYPQVQEIYIAYYGRPADPAGLQYWAGQLAANRGNLSAIINAFGNSAESTALYAGATNTAKVTAIYQQLFNRAPDTAGLTFYTNALTAGTMTAASIALNVADGATGVDATYLSNKMTVAQAFTDALTTDSAANLAYAGTTAATSARSLITGVTTSAATATVASTISSIKSGGGAAAGQTFTLTTAPDNLTGTSGNDTFVASYSTTNATIDTTDIVNAGSGTDTLSIRIANAATADTIAPSISGFEVITIDNDDTTGEVNFNTGSAEGIATITLSGSSAGSLTNVNNLAAAAAISLNNARGTLAVDFATSVYNTSSDAITVSLNKAGDAASGGVAATLVLDGSVTGGTTALTSEDTLETVTITSSTNASRVDLVGGSAVKTLNISGDAALILTDATDNFTALETVSAASYTGNLNLSMASNTRAVTITTGSGNDRVAIGAIGTGLLASDTINLGTGTDTIAVTDSTFTADDISLIKTELTSAEKIEITTSLGTGATGSYSYADIVVINELVFTGSAQGTAGAGSSAGSAATGGMIVSLSGVESGDILTVSADLTGGAGGGLVASTTAQTGGAGGTAVSLAPAVDGGSDTITINLTGGVDIVGGAGGSVTATTASAGGGGGSGISAASFEVVNIVSTGTSTNSLAGGAGGTATTGANGAAGTSIVVNTNGVINVTGSRTLNLGTIGGTNASVNAENFTGATLTVNGEAGNNVIKGGSGNDVLDGRAGIDTYTGNGGSDTFIFQLGLAGTRDSHSRFSTATVAATTDATLAVDSITDYTKGVDVISILGTSATTGSAVTLSSTLIITDATASALNAAISSGGRATFASTDDNLVAKVIAVEAAIQGGTATAGQFAFFEHDGSTYVFVSDGTDAASNGDLVIKLTGVTGATSASFDSSNNLIIS